jgi:hypothetical protein
VTVRWHSFHPCHENCWWTPGGRIFAPRLEVKGDLGALEAALRNRNGWEANLSAPDWGWESPDGWWCRAGEVFSPSGAIYTIPNPSGAPTGWWDSPQCRSMTIGPEGAHWFTDVGTHSVGCVCNGNVTEYPLPELPPVARGYNETQESNPPLSKYLAVNVPGAITAVGNELWVASATGEGMTSVCPSCPAKAARHRRARA